MAGIDGLLLGNNGVGIFTLYSSVHWSCLVWKLFAIIFLVFLNNWKLTLYDSVNKIYLRIYVT